ncbi:mitochondrial FAD-linked sulfhydryl oxidase [Nematocida homosporus]|uniref:mitochondrial FAD-linked sulfhydryl oxidase n=1 Tax=Nematocida homosporus TaxID=1912981 RepID=UPI002220147F|nr:mitochondrial FAD-linked sulfhydryl oxidase [Nematocida homosporus]KAI5185648.1 mitochondrial FAD-linked sulfhydryl oxidase [Nematocida homosporus]
MQFFSRFWNTRRSPTPQETKIVGRSTWILLHSIANHLPNRPTTEQKHAFHSLIHSLSVLYPCRSCATAFKALLAAPIPCDTRSDLATTLCHFHNFVNQQLGKPELNCQVIIKNTEPRPLLAKSSLLAPFTPFINIVYGLWPNNVAAKSRVLR